MVSFHFPAREAIVLRTPPPSRQPWLYTLLIILRQGTDMRRALWKTPSPVEIFCRAAAAPIPRKPLPTARLGFRSFRLPHFRPPSALRRTYFPSRRRRHPASPAVSGRH